MFYIFPVANLVNEESSKTQPLIEKLADDIFGILSSV